MPKIANQWINVEAEDGAKYSFKAATFVSSQGSFEMQIDERVEEFVQQCLDRRIHPQSDTIFTTYRHVISFKYQRGKKFACAKTLHEAKKYCEILAEEYLSGSESTERVILYSINLDVSFWAADGKVFQDGHAASGHGGEWFRSVFFGHSKHQIAECESGMFSIGAAAVVFDKITVTRKSGSTVRWERVKNKDDRFDCESSPAFYLNAFHDSINPENEDKYKSMPYSDEAATFFANILKSLAAMALALDSFFSDPEKIKKAIANPQDKFLLTGGNL